MDHELSMLHIAVVALAVPGFLVMLFAWYSRRQRRLHREAMLRGNRIYREWLGGSKKG